MKRVCNTALPFFLLSVFLSMAATPMLAQEILPAPEWLPPADTARLMQLKAEATASYPVPFGYIDNPTAGSAVFGTIVINGWAASNRRITGVNVLVDDVVVKANVPLTIRRTDVCNVFGPMPNCPYTGFQVSLDVSYLSLGPHLISLKITDEDGVTGRSMNIVSVFRSSFEMHGNLERPGTQLSTTGTFVIAGWAVANRWVQAVEVLIDGSYAATANYGLYRPDVCVAFPTFGNCANSGFSLVYDPAQLSAGTHSLQIRVRDLGGATYLFPAIPRTFTKPSTLLLGNLESPRATSANSLTEAEEEELPVLPLGEGMLPMADGMSTLISGWAVGTLGISRVEIYVDSVLVANAPYGSYRPDVCAALGAFPHCPNVGFIHSLSHAGLSVGIHQLRVRVVALNGATLLLPPAGPVRFFVSVVPSTTTTTTIAGQSTTTSTTSTSASTSTTTTTGTGTTTTTYLPTGTPVITGLSQDTISISSMVGMNEFPLVILGTKFAQSCSVSFGGTNVSVVSWYRYPNTDNTRVTVSIPKSLVTAGSKDVVLSNPGGGTVTVGFTVVP